jgi:hypothetical protein
MSRPEQRAVIRYLILKSSVGETTTELESLYCADSLKYSTVSKWRLLFQEGSDDLFDSVRSGRPSRSQLAAPIQSLLQQFPFISCRVLCRKLKIGKAICLRVLHDDLHLEKFNLRYVPHLLEADQKRWRTELPRALLQILEQDQQYEFKHMLTGDKSWSPLDIFIIRAEPQNQKTRLKFRSKNSIRKCLISIIWGSRGIESLSHVPRGRKYNTTFFVESVVPDLVEHVCQENLGKTLQKIMVHPDNGRPHNSRKSEAALTATKARRIPAPAYSPHLPPVDFFLFGMPKEQISGTAYSSSDELISSINELIASLPKDELVSICKN